VFRLAFIFERGEGGGRERNEEGANKSTKREKEESNENAKNR